MAYGHLGATYGYDSIFGYNPTHSRLANDEDHCARRSPLLVIPRTHALTALWVPQIWKQGTFYFDLKHHCLGYVDQLQDWLEQDIYGGDAMSQEKLLGVAHNQFNLAPGKKIRHTDVLPPIPPYDCLLSIMF